MELLREYSVSDNQLLADAKKAINSIYSNSIDLNLSTVATAREIEECMQGLSSVNSKIQECTDIQKLYIFQQSKILKLNRLAALLDNTKSLSREIFINHEPVRIAQIELATQKIFAS